MIKRRQIYIVPMIGLGITQSSLEVHGLFCQITKYQFAFIEVSVWRYCKLNN